MTQKKQPDPNSQSEGSVFQMKHVLVVGIAVIVGFFILNRRISQLKVAAGPEIEESVADKPQILPNATSETFDADKYAKEIVARRKKVFAAESLGLKSLALKKEKGKVRIPFVFVPRKVWCQGGDLDTIRYAVKRKDSREVLVSLESMDSNKVKEGIHVSSDMLLAGFKHTFVIDASSSAKSLALSICLDRKKAGSCRKAQVLDQAALNAKLGSNSNRIDGDYLFYFQHLIFNGESVQTYRTDNHSEQFKKNLNAFLSDADIDNEASQQAWKTSGKIKSNPLEIQNGKIILSLPYNDPRCLPGR